MSEPSENHSPPSDINFFMVDDEYPSSFPTIEIRHSSSDLCATCSSLPLEAALGGVTPSINLRIKVANVGTYYQKQPAYPPCALCRLLCGSRIDSPELTEKLNNRQGGEELVALSFLRHCYNTIGHGTPATCGNDSIMLALAPSGFQRSNVHPLPSIRQALEEGAKNKGCLVARWSDSREPPGITARIVSQEFDELLARSWITYCQHHHESLCSKTGGEVAGLRLIDYQSLEVISAPKHAPYVALSYVCGSSQMEELPFRFGGIAEFGDLTSLPYTLADAIREHEEAKQHQMEQMNLIYHNAELTIIAAARSDVQYGLPGVGAGYRPRIPQQVVKIGNIEIVPTMRHPHSAIQVSEWSTRAWTFQEGILSRRCLVFTNDQMYFECDGMNCHESVTNVPKRNDHWSNLEYCQQIENSLDELHALHKRESDRTLRPGILGWNDKHRFGQPDRPGLHAAFVQFLEMIQAYSARELMRPSDAPKAFYGIASKFEVIPDRIDQIWGIPFYCNEERTREETFVAGLAWNHKARAGYDLDGLPMPRGIFPTWSWMNWSGEVEYRELDLYKDRPISAFNSAVASVVLEADDGELLTISEYLEIPQAGINRSETPKAVRLETWVFPPSTVVVAESSHLTLLGDPASLHTSIVDFLFNPGLASLAQRGLEFETEWICIYLGSVESKRICLVVRSSCDDGWERVGLLFSWSDRVDEWCANNPRRNVRLL